LGVIYGQEKAVTKEALPGEGVRKTETMLRWIIARRRSTRCRDDGA
jgi:ribosomal protein L14